MFDLQGAKKEGYKTPEINDFLAKRHSFDVKGARTEGYNEQEILSFLTARESPAGISPRSPVQPSELTPGTENASWADMAKDTAIDLGVGTVNLGQAAVGVGDILTGNLLGEGLSTIGYDPKKTVDILQSHYSGERKQQLKEVHQAEGFMNTAKELIDNPGVAFGTIIQSSPLTLSGAGAARYAGARLLSSALAKNSIKKGSPQAIKFAKDFFANPAVKKKIIAAGAAAEGTTVGGLMQEKQREAGKGWAESLPYSGGAAATTAGIGYISSFVPGFRDAEAMLGTAQYESRKSLLQAGKEIATTTFKEGVLEELPQESTEQVWENLALGRPWDYRVGESGAMGMFAGAGTGAGMATLSNLQGRTPDPDNAVDDGLHKKAQEFANDIINGLYDDDKESLFAELNDDPGLYSEVTRLLKDHEATKQAVNVPPETKTYPMRREQQATPQEPNISDEEARQFEQRAKYQRYQPDLPPEINSFALLQDMADTATQVQAEEDVKAARRAKPALPPGERGFTTKEGRRLEPRLESEEFTEKLEKEGLEPQRWNEVRRQAREMLRENLGYKAVTEAKARGGIDYNALTKDYPDFLPEIRKRRPGLISKKGKVKPDEFAEEMGFGSEDELLDSMRQAPTIEEQARRIVSEAEGETASFGEEILRDLKQGERQQGQDRFREMLKLIKQTDSFENLDKYNQELPELIRQFPILKPFKRRLNRAIRTRREQLGKVQLIQENMPVAESVTEDLKVEQAEKEEQPQGQEETQAEEVETAISKEERFESLANAQRGEPEKAMLKVQRTTGGGVLNPVVEHAGDLIHRMAQKPSFFRGGYEYVKEKVDKVHRALNEPYGFEKEMSENMENNANYSGISVDEMNDKVTAALKQYADEHSKLPVYNKAQSLARNLAVAIGSQKFAEARRLVGELKKHTDQGRDHWEEFALRDRQAETQAEEEQQRKESLPDISNLDKMKRPELIATARQLNLVPKGKNSEIRQNIRSIINIKKGEILQKKAYKMSVDELMEASRLGIQIPINKITWEQYKEQLQHIGLNEKQLEIEAKRHKSAVETAYKAGEDIPEEILRKYSDLQSEKAQKPASTEAKQKLWEMTQGEYSKYFSKNKDSIKTKNGFVEGDYYINAAKEKIKIGNNIDMSFMGRPSNMPQPWKLVSAENYYSTVDYGNHVRLTVEAQNGKTMTFDNAEVYSPHPIEQQAVEEAKQKPKFTPGETAYIYWEATGKDEPVNFRGYMEDGQAVVVKDGQQLTVPAEDLKREAEQPVSEEKPEQYYPLDRIEFKTSGGRVIEADIRKQWDNGDYQVEPLISNNTQDIKPEQIVRLIEGGLRRRQIENARQAREQQKVKKEPEQLLSWPAAKKQLKVYQQSPEERRISFSTPEGGSITVGSIIDTKKQYGNNSARRYETSDGGRFERLKDAKQHEIDDLIRAELASEGYLEREPVYQDNLDLANKPKREVTTTLEQRFPNLKAVDRVRLERDIEQYGKIVPKKESETEQPVSEETEKKAEFDTKIAESQRETAKQRSREQKIEDETKALRQHIGNEKSFGSKVIGWLEGSKTNPPAKAYGLKTGRPATTKVTNKGTPISSHYKRAQEIADSTGNEVVIVDRFNKQGIPQNRYFMEAPGKFQRLNLTTNTQRTVLEFYLDDAVDSGKQQIMAVVKPEQTEQGTALYSRNQPTGNTAPKVRREARKFLRKGYRKLVDAGKLEVVQSEIPEEGTPIYDNGKTAGKYLNGKITLIADNIANTEGVLKHEGLHLLMREDPWFTERYEKILTRFENSTDERVKQAFDRVPTETPAELRREEAFGYFLENNKDQPLYKRVISTVKAWLARWGLPVQNWTPDDMAAMVTQGIKRVSRTSQAKNFLQAQRAMASGTAPRWYSRLQNTITEKGPKTAPVKQWLSTLQQWKDKGTLPEPVQEELEWTGLEDWLGQQEGKVSRDEVMDYLRANAIQVEEVTKGEVPIKDTIVVESWEKDENEWVALTTGADEADLRIRKEGTNQYDIYSEGERMGFAYTLEDAKTEAAGIFGQREGEVEYSDTKFSNYQLPGGENYRELLLRLPSYKKTINDLSYEMFGKDLTLLRGRDMQAVIQQMADEVPASYKSQHWDETNVLAHVRFNERTDSEGNRVLFIEEIQSDLHQEGRKKGYTQQKKESLKIYTQLYRKLPEAAVIDSDGSYIIPSGETGQITDYMTKKESKDLLQAIANLSGAVPNAPFKTTWPTLAMKRMVRYAAENGFDKVAWTPGEVQAERYDLSKHLDSIRWDSIDDEKFISLVGVKGVSGQDFEFVVNNKTGIIRSTDLGPFENLRGKHLSDAVGKDVSDKILADKKGVLSDEGLKVGGQGIKSFYDQIVPSAVNHFFNKKAWGKAKAEKVEIDEAGEAWALPITPEMRAKALGEGMPLFSKTDPEAVKKGQEEIDKIMTRLQKARGKKIEVSKPETQKVVKKWLDTKEKLSSERKDIENTIKTFKNYLMTAPPNVWAKGMKKMPKLTRAKTPETRERYLNLAIAEVEHEVQLSSAKETRNSVKNLIKNNKSKVKKAKRTGTLGEVHGYFDKLWATLYKQKAGHESEAMQRVQEVRNKMTQLYSEPSSQGVQRELNDLYEEEAILLKYGGYKDKDYAQLAAMQAELENMRDTGKAAWAEFSQAWKEEMDKHREQLWTDISGEENPQPETRAEKKERQNKENKATQNVLRQITQFDNIHHALPFLLDKATRKGKGGTRRTASGDAISSIAEQGTEKKQRLLLDWNQKAEDKLREIFGFKDTYSGKRQFAKKIGEYSNVDKHGIEIQLYREVEDGYEKGGKVPLSQAEAAYLYGAWMNVAEQSRMTPTADREGILNIDEVIEKVDPKLLQMVDWFSLEMAEEIYDTVNSEYTVVNGSPLGKVARYWPMVVESNKVEEQDMGLTQTTAQATVDRMATHERRSKMPLRFNVSAFDVIFDHINDMAHYSAWAVPTKMLDSIFKNPTTRAFMEKEHGNNMNWAFDQFTDHFKTGNKTRREMLQRLERWRGRYATFALGANPLLFIKQTASLPAMAANVPVKDFSIGLAKFFANPVKAAGVLKDETFIKARWKQGYQRDVAIANRQTTSQMAAGIQNLPSKLMFMVRLGDMSPVIAGGYAVYYAQRKKSLKEGFSEAEAHKAALKQVRRTIEDTQQSAEMMSRSLAEQGGPLQRLLTMFYSAQRSYYQNVAAGIRNFPEDPKDSAKRLFLFWVVLPSIFEAISYAPLLGSDDDDKRELAMKRITKGAALGPLQGMIIVRDAADYIYNQAFLKSDAWMDPGYAPPADVIKTMGRIAGKTGKLAQGEDIDMMQFYKYLNEFAGQATGIPTENLRKFWEAWFTDTDNAALKKIGYSEWSLGE